MIEHNKRTERSLDIVIGIRLRMHRKRLGLTIRQLAPKLNATPFEVSEYERGIRPLYASQLCIWLMVLGVDPAEFFRPPLRLIKKPTRPCTTSTYGQ
ncbi:MAG: helix-turn-helix transcriptional regulator [Planctomycetota bacterium]